MQIKLNKDQTKLKYKSSLNTKTKDKWKQNNIVISTLLNNKRCSLGIQKSQTTELKSAI